MYKFCERVLKYINFLYEFEMRYLNVLFLHRFQIVSMYFVEHNSLG